jgi:hypothetical protein
MNRFLSFFLFAAVFVISVYLYYQKTDNYVHPRSINKTHMFPVSHGMYAIRSRRCHDDCRLIEYDS